MFKKQINTCLFWTKCQAKESLPWFRNFRGCRFHLGQSWRWTIQAIRLTRKYKEDKEVNIYLKCFFWLPFFKLSGSRWVLRWAPDRNAATRRKFWAFHRLRITNLHQRTFGQNFTFQSTKLQTAAKHSTLNINWLFSTAHSNVFIFINVLKDIQSEVYAAIRSRHHKRNTEATEEECFLREKM